MTTTENPDVRMLRLMATIRQFETEASRLGNRGQIMGALHTSIGQEAVCVGACAALGPDDYMTGHHRSHGHPIAKGADVRALMAELMGKRTGICHGNGGSMHLADFSVGSLGESAIVGSSLAIAAGAGLAISLQGTDRVCLAFFGDGASNAGIFHEALNLAAVWDLPVVFLCENNGYAVTTRHQDACAVEQIADRAASYAMPGVVVDGQDVRAVRDAVAEAAARARAGGGPSLVEAMTYRYDGHSFRSTTPRAQEEVDRWRRRDPVTMFEQVLVAEGVLDEADVLRLHDRVAGEIAEAIELATAAPDPTFDDIVRDMYVDPITVSTPSEAR